MPGQCPFNLLHPCSCLVYYHLSSWCFSTFVNYYFEAFFKCLTVILHFAKMTLKILWHSSFKLTSAFSKENRNVCEAGTLDCLCILAVSPPWWALPTQGTGEGRGYIVPVPSPRDVSVYRQRRRVACRDSRNEVLNKFVEFRWLTLSLPRVLSSKLRKNLEFHFANCQKQTSPL